MTPVLLCSLLLAPAPGIHVDVLGEGKLRFLVGHKASVAASANLSVNPSGLLADETGKPVSPAIKIGAGALRISMNGVVTVAGTKAGRLLLERPGKDAPDLAYPGEDGMGVLQITASATPTSTTPGKTASTTAPISKAVVTMRASSDLPGDRVLLKDIADIEGDAATIARLNTIDIGTLPLLGIRRTLNVWSVKSALRSQGIPEGMVTLNFPPDVTVGRKGQNIDADTLVAEAKNKALEVVKAGVLNLCAGPAPLFVPTGEVTFDTAFERHANFITMTVKVSVDAKPVGTRVIKFQSEGTGIKYGDAVRITLRRNGAVIETDGKAKSAGFVGESIQVMTADGATLSATVTSASTVEVKL